MNNIETNLDETQFNFIIAKCRDCGYSFTITPAQQAFLARRKLGLFTHCPECREKRRLEKLEANNGQGGDHHDS